MVAHGFLPYFFANFNHPSRAMRGVHHTPLFLMKYQCHKVHRHWAVQAAFLWRRMPKARMQKKKQQWNVERQFHQVQNAVVRASPAAGWRQRHMRNASR
jgi:hypothetical protein